MILNLTTTMLIMVWPIFLSLVVGMPLSVYIARKRFADKTRVANEGVLLTMWLSNGVMATLLSMTVYLSIAVKPSLGIALGFLATFVYGIVMIVTAVAVWERYKALKSRRSGV